MSPDQPVDDVPDGARLLYGQQAGRNITEQAGLNGQAPATTGLAEVNDMSCPDALIWYNRNGYAAYPASPGAKMLMLPRGYKFDDLGVLGEEHLAHAHEAWRQRPDMRVALIMGNASGLVAIDVDDLAEWEAFYAEHAGMTPPTAIQATGREGGGFHLLYRRDDIDPELLKQGRWPDFPHIELKVKAPLIAAPSLHESGRRYQWQAGPGEPVPISAALLDGFRQGREQLRAMAREIVQQVEMDGRPALDAGNAADLADVLCARLGAGCFTGVYQRDDKLVVVPRFGENGYVPAAGPGEDPSKNSPAQMRALSQNLLQGLIASRAWTYKTVKTGPDTWEKTHTLPPLAACSAAIHADPARWEKVPVLAGVVHIPLLRRDGTLLTEPGYDETTGLLYLPLPGQAAVTVPEHPTLADVQDAAGRLWSLFSQFGWTSRSDYLNYLAAVLVPPLRLLLPPPWPLWVVNAHDRGSGKTLLTEVPRILHGGVIYAAPGDDSEETRKLITTILASTTGSVVGLDNAEKVLRSRHLAALFTDPSGMWHDRRLGTNESPGLPNDRAWVLNGNNVRLGGDLPRRALWASIDPKEPEPWLRTEFTIPDLAGHVSANRTKIIADILVLGRYWALAGFPGGSMARGDSFAKFAGGMSGLMETCKLAGPGEFWAPSTNRAEDGADDEDWAAFLAAVYSQQTGQAWTARQTIEACQAKALEGGGWQSANAVIVDALPGDIGAKVASGAYASAAKSLGWWLTNHEGRWTSGRHAVRQAGGGRSGHPKLWTVEHRP
jgi:hypothetical protein